jgi:hypothetical protein
MKERRQQSSILLEVKRINKKRGSRTLDDVSI